MGFEIYEEDDITSELYGFDNLNFPPNHPARESMDTYWLEGHDKGECWDKLCLRPHLTGGSVRYMQTHKPPYRFVYPGKVYRLSLIHICGDILTGLAAGLLAQGMEPFAACCCAVWLHGRAGDLAAADKGRRGMTPSDLLEKLPYALKEVE